MASLQSLHHRLLHNHHHRHHHNQSFPCTDTILFLKPTKKNLYSNLSPSSLTTSSSASSSPIIPTTTTHAPTPSPSSTSLDLLIHHLSTQNFRQADNETRRLLIALAGDAAQKRGYVFFSEVQFISLADIQAIDSLWLQHSQGKFGYSVQRKVWQKTGRDFTRFFIKVGWMKKLDTEIEQYNYSAFPQEFIWELRDDTPVGHLPLTNALRGTQLLASILTHPAFEAALEEEEEGADDVMTTSAEKTTERPKKSIGSLKSDYSF